MNSEWIVFLYHSPSCGPGFGCKYGEGCEVGRQLWAHILHCSQPRCGYRNCLRARTLLWHFWNCRETRCPLCAPVRSRIMAAAPPSQRQQPPEQAGQESTTSPSPSSS